LYGGRGISICQRWRKSFVAFYRDVGPRPSRQHSIDRIDNDGHYTPGNVKWSTTKEQNNNRRSCRMLTFHGESLTVEQWAERFGMRADTIRHRLGRGWPVEMALTAPIRSHRR